MTKDIIFRKLIKIGVKQDAIPENIEQYLKDYGIVTDDNVYIFLANVMNETGLLTKVVENMNYTKVETLKRVFPRAFVKMNYNPAEYVRQPMKLGNLVYDSRLFPKLGLGNDQPGDGYKYRGRGWLQATGKYLYKLLSEEFGVDFVKNPDLLATKEFAICSGLSYWRRTKMGSAGSLLAARRIMAGIKTGTPEGYNNVLKLYNQLKAA